MKLRARERIAAAAVAAALAGGAASACQSTCEEQLDCGPYEGLSGGDAGAAGAGADSGSGGSAFGGSGTAGSLGQAGSGGSAGALGASGGEGGGADPSGGDGSGGDGVSAHGGQGGAPEPPCDVDASPRLERCLVDERFAVFVSPDGDDAAAGTRAAPVATLQRALAMARASDRRVLACRGVYAEALAIDGESAAMLHGGFACDGGWEPADDASIVAPEIGPALRVAGARGAVVIEDFELRAADGVSPGESSIAAMISDAADVTLRRARLSAGRGVSGESGESPEFAFPGEPELQGHDGQPDAGGDGDACACPSGVPSVRGAGGGLSERGEAGTPDHDGPGGEPGSIAASCTAGGSGLDGAAGPHAEAAPGASKLGVLTASGWTPAPGESGLPGAPGQGGGGGAGKAGGGGGSGGCGGCGGRGGTGGKGGGASIGLAMLDSRVTLEVVQIITGDAGDGGDGGVGQAGQAIVGGGGIGYGTSAVRGCFGGNGGPGGNGGAGGGGAGGVSVGVLFHGYAPTLRDSTLAVGEPGRGGVGNDVALSTDDGVEGVKADTLEIQ